MVHILIVFRNKKPIAYAQYIGSYKYNYNYEAFDAGVYLSFDTI